MLGVNTQAHNTGAALVRISQRACVELVCNEEEERYTGVKHYGQYPVHSIEAIKRHMQALGLGPEDLAACVSAADYASAFNISSVHPILEEAPASLGVLQRERSAQAKMPSVDLANRNSSGLFQGSR